MKSTTSTLRMLTKNVHAPTQFEITAIDDPEIAALLDLSAEWDPSRHGYVVTSLRASQRPGGEPVTGSLLRSIPVSAVLSQAVLRNISHNARTPRGRPKKVFEEVSANWEAITASGPTPDALNWVGIIHDIALLAGEPPTKSVADWLHLAPRTASHWVKLARERGHIG